MRPTQRRRAHAWLLILTAGASLVPPTVASACPAYIAVRDLPTLPAGKRGDLRLFAVQTTAGRRHWQMLPVQVDPLDADGVLLGPPEVGPGLAGLPLAKDDRLTLRREGFGARAQLADGAPCQAATSGLELVNPAAPEQVAYLVSCGGKPAPLPSPVVHVPERLLMSTPKFEYEYHPNNQLLYRRLVAKGPWGAPLLAAQDGAIDMHLDVKNFFTMDFTNKDVESYVSQTISGPVGLLAGIDFYLRLLFFKINLKMTTTAAFYADSAHIPMLIDVPVDAATHLHPGSGLLYTWVRKAATIDQSHPERTMPNADPALILAGGAKLTAAGLPFCQGDLCTFRLRGGVGTDAFGLDLLLPKTMVQHNFFPQFVADVAAFKQAAGWEDQPVPVAGEVAVYFNNSGLPKGQYRTDQWIHVGKAEDVAAPCPRAVTPGKPLAFP